MLIDVYGFAPTYDVGAAVARKVATKLKRAVFLDTVAYGSRFYDPPRAPKRADRGAWVIWADSVPGTSIAPGVRRLHPGEILSGRVRNTLVEPSRKAPRARRGRAQ